MTDKYDASGSSEGQAEPESDGLVLANKLGITSLDEIENVEFDAILVLQNMLFDEFGFDRSITTKDLCDWHLRWLNVLYKWAGNYRSVNMSKNDFQFAVAHQVQKLMDDFNNEILSAYTPCNTMNEVELIQALAQTHVEFILIHPFRDGNGRLARLMMTIMALQAGQPVLNFTYIEENKEEYILAIHAGMDRNYRPMESVVTNVLKSSRD